MIQMPCPNCGSRNVAEFRSYGEETSRPDPDGASPEEWRTYLYRKRNPAGWTTETWCHVAGCRAFFVAERHTVTNEIRSTCLPAGSEP